MAADANSSTLRYVVESTYGTDPGGTYTEVDFTSESLQQENSTITSNIIRADRQVSGVVRNGISSAGAVNIEWKYGGGSTWVNDWLQYAMLDGGEHWSTETTVISGSTNVTVAASNDRYTLGSGSWTATPTVGEWIEVRGFATNTENNGYKKVTAATTTTIDVDDALTDDSTGDSITIKQGTYLHNGTSLNTITMEKEWTSDVVSGTSRFHKFGGIALNTMSSSFDADTLVTGSFGLLGKSQTIATSTGASGNNAVPSTDSYNSIDHLQTVRLGSNEISVIGIDWELNNNLRTRLQAGTLGALSIGKGSVTLTGTIRAYFEAGTDINDFINHTSTSLSYPLEDAAGNTLIFDFPEVKLTAAPTLNEGINTDVIKTFQFTASRDSSETNHHGGTGGSDGDVAVDGVTFRIARFAA